MPNNLTQYGYSLFGGIYIRVTYHWLWWHHYDSVTDKCNCPWIQWCDGKYPCQASHTRKFSMFAICFVKIWDVLSFLSVRLLIVLILFSPARLPFVSQTLQHVWGHSVYLLKQHQIVKDTKSYSPDGRHVISGIGLQVEWHHHYPFWVLMDGSLCGCLHNRLHLVTV